MKRYTTTFAAALILASLISAVANPVIDSHKAYIHSENVVIAVHSNYCSIDASFVFRSLETDAKRKDIAVLIDYPVYFPRKGHCSVPFVAIWDEIKNPEHLQWVQGNSFENELKEDEGYQWDVSTNSFSAVFGLEMEPILPGRRPQDTFSITFGDDKNWGHVLPKPHNGVAIAWFRSYISSQLMTNGSPLSIRYKQGHFTSDGTAYNIYTPMLPTLAKLKRDPSQFPKLYRVEIIPDSGLTVSLLGKHTVIENTNGSIIVSPSHRKPIQFKIKRAQPEN